MTSLAEIGNVNGSSNAISRWATLGPYYAMFPIDFAFDVVNEHSKRGEHIIDPFAGRFSAVYAGAVLGRHSVGIEINPVGWIYGQAKSDPASEEAVLRRLDEISKLRDLYSLVIDAQDEFFRMCFCDEVLKFLLAVRDHLNWRGNKTDRTLMSIIMVHLHAKLGEGLSNQMRQTKAMARNYSINWWKANGFEKPPDYDPLAFLRTKIIWRYKKGIPSTTADCRMFLGDSTKRLNGIIRDAKLRRIEYSLLFTSPPYQAVVNYHSDQWLRLWLLNEQRSADRYQKRFNSRLDYENLLDNVFHKCSKLMKTKSTIFVRTDIRPFTFETTINALKRHFPKHRMEAAVSEVRGKSQTELFNNSSLRKEVDIKLIR